MGAEPVRTLGELLGGEAEVTPGAAAVAITGMTADSREVARGFLFAALPGSRADGLTFVPAALAKGAAAVLAPVGADLRDAGVPVVRSADPRRALAVAAARFAGPQPREIVAVTGTNGKTSVAVFTRQIFEAAGFKAASMGTIGLVVSGRQGVPTLTTPDPVSLARTLADLKRDGVEHVALEASSHGLDQRRLDGVRLAAGAFTNLSRDHLDYHPTLDDYRDAKLRLFDTLLPEGAGAVANADAPEAARIRVITEQRGLSFIGVGEAGETLRLAGSERTGTGTRLHIVHEGRTHTVDLPLIGAFQVSNALVAAGLAIAAGIDVETAIRALEGITGASGRLELVGRHASGAPVFVDYAHTPEAIENVAQALRPHVAGRLVVVVGAGGDRDPGKRPLMGRAAAENAELVIVTDDNPRSEDPAAIRQAVLSGAATAGKGDTIEIGDRREAIRAGVAMLRAGDVLLVAGKGHETGQIVGKEVLPFSDQEEARAALAP